MLLRHDVTTMQHTQIHIGYTKPTYYYHNERRNKKKMLHIHTGSQEAGEQHAMHTYARYVLRHSAVMDDLSLMS